jgi:lipopolysaccharide biosynthesis glycosyltransferase
MKKCYAYATTLTHGDAYAPGVEALGRSLEATGTDVPRVLMVTPDVPHGALVRLADQGWILRGIEPVKNPTPLSQQLFPRFDKVFTKLRAWELVEYEKVVLLDADMVVRKNLDHLFDRPEVAAAPDFLLPHSFNSGLMVLDPSRRTFDRMMRALAESPTYDGGDQGFLNTFFGDWFNGPGERRLPTWYNLPNFIYQFMRGHPSLREQVEREAAVIHYLVQKPWQSASTVTGGSELWWSHYLGVHPEADSGWKRRLHAMEDKSFDRAIAAFVG